MALPHLRTCLAYTKYAAGTIFAASMTSAWYYRPIADTATISNSTKSTTAHNNNNNNNNDNRSNETFCTPYTSPPWSRDHVPLLLSWARYISIGATTLAIRLLMNTYGQYQIKDDDCYQTFLQTVLGGNNRQPNQGLITVSNHRSLFDDPGIVSCLLPLSIAIQPKYNRWAICSQEYCFNDALPGLIKGYIGAGQVLPICRGGGIDQKLLLDFGRHLACGEWCHVFPEGGVWQWEELGGRKEMPEGAIVASSSDIGGGNNKTATNNKNNNNVHAGDNDDSNDDDDRIQIVNATLQQKSLPPSPKGKLKWGVGKLIAHAPITPKVIPFAHRGMEHLLPQDEHTGKTKLRDNLLHGLLPRVLTGGSTNNDVEDATSSLDVRVQFGKEITFDDLIYEHEVKHGTLWKYCGTVNAEEEYNNNNNRNNNNNDHKQQQQKQGGRSFRWESSLEERALYSKILRRIETRLDLITREVCEKK